MRAALALLVVGAVGASACYSPKVADGQYLCPDKVCPAGQTCSACGVCVRPGAPDGGVSCPGCALGSRSPEDPGLPNLAFCPAAWTVPGVLGSASLATPCNREPAQKGAGCTVEDNCEPGWHVCATDGDVEMHGLTKEDCAGLDIAQSFWATRQPGLLGGAPDATGAVGTYCATGPMATARVIGCGALYPRGVVRPAGPGMGPSCNVLQRYIGFVTTLTPPPMPVFDCTAGSNEAWVCTTMQGMEGLLVTKPKIERGGVICCRN
jgi:hypothetical protein